MARIPEPELERGETLLWSGAPPQGPILRAGDAFIIPFSLLWAGGVIATFRSAQISGAGTSPAGFFQLAFLVPAAYITFGRFILDAWLRSRTAYAVTSDRIVITSRILSTSVKSLNIRTLTDITLDEGSNGTGSITFGPAPRQAVLLRAMPWPGVPAVAMFERIKDARGVYQTIRAAQQKVVAGGGPRIAPST